MTSRIKTVLITSLILNILLLGITLGAVSHHFLWRHAGPHSIPDVIAQLPENKRKLFEDTMRGAWHIDTMHTQMMDAKQEASRVLTADSFNEEAYLTQIQHMNDLHNRIKRRLAEAVTELSKQFTPQERVVLAEVFSRPFSELSSHHVSEADSK